jgi:hypothetical protein
MLFKIITLFLLVMVLIGMVGKFLFPNAGPRLGSRFARRKPVICNDCSRPLIGKTCSCKAKP